MLPFRRLVIATHNGKKAGEMVQILSGRFPELEIVTLADYPGAPEPEETGETYAENAAIKSESAARFTGEWCLADDAGLEIDALNGAPGVHSKRYEGEDTPFPIKMAKILAALEGVSQERRAARFRCCIALTAPEWNTQILESTCEGRIAEEPSGVGGFGYDPIFFLPEKGCTMADLTPHQKHEISHRGKVLRQLAEYLQTMSV
jgi:XTP/dITP diphosphohydrolase